MEIQELIKFPNKIKLGQVNVVPSTNVGEALSSLPFNKEDIFTQDEQSITDQVGSKILSLFYTFKNQIGMGPINKSPLLQSPC